MSVRFAEGHEQLCVFELIYFGRPDSYMLGRNLYESRRRMGVALAAEAPVEADIVMPVPDTGAPAAAGYAEGAGLPYREGMVRNRYSGRTFIQPRQGMRQRGVNGQAEPAARSRRRQASDRRGRLDRARHHHPPDRGLLRKAGATRGPPADQRAADPPPLLLRHRHPDRDRADRLDPFGRGDPRVRRRRLAGATSRSAACCRRWTCRTTGSASPASTAGTRCRSPTTRPATSSSWRCRRRAGLPGEPSQAAGRPHR